MKEKFDGAELERIKAILADNLRLTKKALAAEGYGRIVEGIEELEASERLSVIFTRYGTKHVVNDMAKKGILHASFLAFRDTFSKNAQRVFNMHALSDHKDYISSSLDECYNSFRVGIDDWLYALDIGRSELQRHLPEIDEDEPFKNAVTFLQFLAVVHFFMLPKLKENFEAIIGGPLETDLDQKQRKKLMKGKNTVCGLPEPRP